MCGIAGWHGGNGEEDPLLLQSMLSAIVHRGPDDEGRFVFIETRPAILLHSHIALRYTSNNGVIENHRAIHHELHKAVELIGDLPVLLQVIVGNVGIQQV